MTDKVEKITNSSFSGASLNPVTTAQHTFDTTGGNRGLLAELTQAHPPIASGKGECAGIDLLVKDADERRDNMLKAAVNLCPEVVVDGSVPENNAAAVMNPDIIGLNDVTKIDVITPATNNHYASFRGALAKSITEALTSGGAVYERKLFSVDGMGVGKDRRILSFDTWRNTLHPTMQQHYNCNACRANWDVIFSVAVQREDGTIYYPAVEALKEAHRHNDPVIGNLFHNAPGNAEGFIAYLEEASKPIPHELFPLFRVPEHMNADADVGGWEHFHLAEIGVLQNYNENRNPFGDVHYTDLLFKRLIDKRFDGEAFSKLCETIRKDVLDKRKETFSMIDSSALMRYPDLIQLVAEINLYHKVSGTGLVYLHERLGRAANGYLRHLNSSVLGKAFDAYFDLLDNPSEFDEIINKVTGILSRAADAANYKNKVAEAKPATLEQAYKFLQDNGLQTTLMRRLVDLSEVAGTVWKETPSIPVVKEEAKPAATLDEAFKEVMATKDTEATRLASLKEKLGLRIDRAAGSVKMSVKAFLANSANYTEISMNLMDNPRVMPYIATTATDPDTDHSKLLRFHSTYVPYVLHYTTPSHIPSTTFALDNNIDNNLDVINTKPDVTLRKTDLSVTAILESTDSEGQIANIAIIPGAAGVLTHLFTGNGTAIIPAVIQGDHYGMSKAFQELSSKLKLVVKEGCDVRDAIGGIYIAPGVSFDVTKADGTKESVYLTSYD